MIKVGVELSKLFERDFKRLENELNLYSEEQNLWIVKGEIANSAGNLALHLCGNLKHFIGATLAKSGYERDRPFEFSGKVSKAELIKDAAESSQVVINYLNNVSEEELSEEFPLQPFGHPMSVSEFLFHLYGHFNYHLGQINYHRRLLNLE